MNGPSKPPASSHSHTHSHFRTIALYALLLVGITVAVYANSFSGVFLFDDTDGILHNLTIRHLWPLSDVLSPPNHTGTTVNGRPILNLTFALNYAVSGVAPWSYHLFNLAIHIVAGLTLFGIIRRTLSLPLFENSKLGRENSLPIAFISALLWVVHPLQTESVTYVIQRAESLVALFYLLTFYTFIRGVEARSTTQISQLWFILSIALCFLGMGTKEVMGTAPLLLFLYDRTFIAGTFREAWRRRSLYYITLGSSWLFLGWLMIGSHSRGATTGFEIGIPWWGYGLRQFQSILTYIILGVFPYSITFDHGFCEGREVITHLWEVIPAAAMVVPLFFGTAWAIWRQPLLGFLGVWFFLILMPSSSIVPIIEIRMEHRVYLSLAALIVVGVCALFLWLGRRSLIFLIPLAFLYGILTIERNRDYRSEIAFWTATVDAEPRNAKAHIYLGSADLTAEHLTEAAEQFHIGLGLNPHDATAYNGLGEVYTHLGNLDRAIATFTEAIQIEPGYPDANYNLGNTLILKGEWEQAIPPLEVALRSKPDYFQADDSLGIALAETGHLPEAIDHFKAAIEIEPTSANSHYDLGRAFAANGQKDEAIEQFKEALRLQPQNREIETALNKLEE